MIAAKIIDEKYEIQKEIKRGGFGVIYQGIDLAFNKPIAIKAVEPSLLGEARYIDMFRDEALSVARLNHHNIVQIYDIRREENGQLYIIMEYVDGPDLSRLLRICRRTHTRLPVHLGVYIMTEVCSGLDYAHNRRDPETQEPLNIVHQDVSPSNIMISQQGEVKIIDFGMANFARKQTGKKREVVIHGKLNYLAPEQLNGGKSLDRRVDIFAMGLVLYEILAGERLIKSGNAQEVYDLLRSGKWDFSALKNQEEISPKLLKTLERALAIDPAKRYANANQMYMDLMHSLIMTAPAADFNAELAEFVQQKIMPFMDEAPPGDSTTIVAEKEISPGTQPAGSRRPKPTSRKKKKAPAVSSTNGDGDIHPGKKISADRENDLLDISESLVSEFENKQNVRRESAGETVAPETGADVQDKSETVTAPAESELQSGPATNHTAETAAPKSPPAEPGDETVIDEPKPEKGPADLQNSHTRGDKAEASEANRKAEETRAPEKTNAFDKAEPDIQILETGTKDDSEAFGKYYSFVEDTGEEEDELKTIIDVVRLSARTHKKAMLLTLISLVVGSVMFTVVDTFAHFTSFGTSIYDYLFPPAIKIVSVPPGAQVYLDNKPLQETTPISIPEISPGVHKLMLTMGRFEPIVKSINVPRKGELQVVGEKKRHPSQPYVFHFKTQLELSSHPPGASVFINGVKLAEPTPITIFWQVSEDPIQISMHHEGLPDLTGLEIDGLKGTETIADRRFWKFQRLDRVKDHFAIEGIFRKPVEIKSIPRRAEIYLDDGEKPVGLTDLNGLLLLTLGQHLITLRKNGYLPRKFSIEVNKDTPGVVRQVLLRQVRIFAKEANSLDDSDIGARIVEVRYGRQRIRVDQSTPTELRLLPYRYTIIFKKPGYEDLFLKIPSTKRTVIARMKRLPARVAVLILDARTREPVNAAEVFYRNLRSQTPAQKLGVTDSTGSVVAEIPAGRYQIEAKKIGYQARAKILNLRGARMNRYTFLLRVTK